MVTRPERLLGDRQAPATAPSVLAAFLGRAVSLSWMQHLAVVASVVLLLIVSVVSTRVLLRVLMPNREEVLRLQNERIERMLRDATDANLEGDEAEL